MHRQEGSGSAAIQQNDRLPACGSPRRCHYNDEVDNKLSNVDLPDQATRPTCIVFDELQPVSAQENSFLPSTRPAVHHKATQTDGHLKKPIQIVERTSDHINHITASRNTFTEPKELESKEQNINEQNENANKVMRSAILPHEDNAVNEPLSDCYTSTHHRTPVDGPDSTPNSSKTEHKHLGSNLRNIIQVREESNTSLSKPINSKPEESKSVRFHKPTLFNLNTENAVESTIDWDLKPHFKSHPTIVVNSVKKNDTTIRKPLKTVSRGTEYKGKEVDKYFSCESLPQLNNQINRIQFEVDRLEAEVNELHTNIASLKPKNIMPAEEHVKIGPVDNKSRDLIMLYNDGALNASGQCQNDWQVYRIPKSKHAARALIPASQPKVNSLKEPVQHYICNTAQRLIDPRTFTECKQHHQGCSFLIKPHFQRSCRCLHTDSTTQLPRHSSSICQACPNKGQLVLSDLCSEIKKLIGHRSFNDILLAVLLRADNVYHVSVQMKVSNQVLGCLLVSHAAIDKAISQGLFDDILTYCAIDVRNGNKSISRPFGSSFELTARCRLAGAGNANESLNKLDLRTREFITKVLGVSADRITLN